MVGGITENEKVRMVMDLEICRGVYLAVAAIEQRIIIITILQY